MNAKNTMNTQHMRHIKRAALATGVGAVLVAGVLVFVPDRGEEPPAPGPEARARAAVGAGAPAALKDVAALIRDREAWLRKNPRDAESWAVLGAAYVERGGLRADTAYYPKAERALRRSLDVTPGERGNPAATAGLATLANARHDYVSARKWGEAVRKADPARWATYPVLIEAYNGLGDYVAAGKALDRLRALHSGTRVLSVSSLVYRDRGWREDAAAKADEALMKAGTPVERAAALHALGGLAWERGEPKKALRHYDGALRAAPDHHQSRAGRARVLAALGRTDEASQDYQSALAERPLPEYALELGELYESMGLDGDARSQYELLRDRTTRAAADGVNEELLLARFETDHGSPKAAVDRLESQWRRGHRSMGVSDALAWALYRAGNAKKALPYAKRATGQGMRSALFSYHRGEIERALGMEGPARRHLEEALRTNPRFSPLLAPKARKALETLGPLPGGGPKDMYGDGESTPLTPSPTAPSRSAGPSTRTPSASPAPSVAPWTPATPSVPSASPARSEPVSTPMVPVSAPSAARN
ncbi:tetratricopeptide repeat protein [Streptomyces sp. IB2014 016-6]|uniref:tetratricopeptide repeat protein n=1 Tax=Streptomyces sp. IB2014 016-6 TaxID=2517818 RepID=UPI0011CAD7B4|nr:tetratricopeptide repeat protein [Streptomyces sp. IB2014 016-6]TXL88855.1 tetratricopeptide repeat protein [Streptomyces sp. IB2014 016-6]